MITALLVDGNSIAHRAFHVSRGLSHEGESTGLLLVFLKMLRAAADELRPKEIWVAWDAGTPKFRLDAFPEYKAKRRARATDAAQEEWRAARAEFNVQRDYLEWHILSALGVRQCSVPGWEADDVIALWVSRSSAEKIVVMSSDRDLWQLVSERIRVWDPNRGEVSLNNFEAVSGLPNPPAWLEFRVLTGDSSDGIPGVGGVGPVRGKAIVAGGGFWATGSEPGSWAWKRAAAYARNRVLMDLGIAAEELRTFVNDHRGPRYDRPAEAVDWHKVEDRLDAKGLVSITAQLDSWLEPFRNLRINDAREA